MKQYPEAEAFAIERHSGQTRWDGRDYVQNHCIPVAKKFTDDLRKTVAVLHDVVEDGKATLQEVRDRFGSTVAAAVDSLSRRSGESYKDFIRRAAKNPIAKDVKIADIEHNMDDVPDDETMKKKAEGLRTKRYIPALLFLSGQTEEL